MIEKIKQKFPSIEFVAASNGDPWVLVPKEQIVPVCRYLHEDLGFDCLSCLTGTDKKDFFEVVYHLFSYVSKEMLVLKVKLEKDALSVSSVSAIWPSANWFERETFDLLGINFEGHPDLRRIMLPDDWVGHPLRKDYVEAAEYQGMSTTREKQS